MDRINAWAARFMAAFALLFVAAFLFIRMEPFDLNFRTVTIGVAAITFSINAVLVVIRGIE